MLSKAQRKAVVHKDGPMMVLAGPGSGKTFTVVERLKYMTEVYDISPENILVITFTTAAADEMKQRYISKCKWNGSERSVTFGTFHSIFFMILREESGYDGKSILKEKDKLNILKDLIDKNNMDIRKDSEYVMSVIGEISKVKTDMIPIDTYISKFCDSDVFKKIFTSYEKYIAKNRYLDFDDMLIKCHELLSERKEIRKKWQERFKYILVDEFQDINEIQYETVRLLGGVSKNIFIVGDDDQSIYGFRGAHPDIMRRFTMDYPEAETAVLNMNFRSGEKIITCAMGLIKSNKNRLDKNIISGKKSKGEVCIKITKDVKEEYEYITKIIEKYKNYGTEYEEMAVLTRTGTQAKNICKYLGIKSIPFVSVEGKVNIYDHYIYKDIFSYVRLATKREKPGDLSGIINRPCRYVKSRDFVEKNMDLRSLLFFHKNNGFVLKYLEDLREQLDILSRMKPFAAVNYIRKGIGYERYLEDYAKKLNIDFDEYEDILDEIQEEAGRFHDMEDWERYVKEQRESFDGLNGQNQTGVNVMTMHKSKGLEFECVLIPDVIEGNIPHGRGVMPEQTEEERRLFYVGMTRAKESLYIICPEKKMHKETDVSRFVFEVQKSLDKNIIYEV